MALSPEDWTAVALSLKVATAATLLGVPLALAAAWWIVRGRSPLRHVLNALTLLPLVLPPVATGYVLLLTFGAQGWLGAPLGEIGITFAFRWTGAALAAGIMAFPLMVRAISLSLAAVDRKIEDAAATLGAPPSRVFVTITLPLILPGLLTGALMGFAKAMGEFGATITFVANIPGETQTLASAIWSALQVPGGDAAAFRLVWVALGIAVLAVILSEVLSRQIARRIGAA